MGASIDSYQFGEIVINGTTYSNDLIILPDQIHTDWWRDEGHVLKPQDLQLLQSSDIDRLIIGTGRSGRMEVPERTRTFLKELGIQPSIHPTAEACREFQHAGEDTGAALHLTC
ncbi:MAG: Mth938-like domain-containing protein [Candidatus Nanohaloarchaea archaeon]|nr:Mth938-like domain-containing protein [Candidatus Nanohaloarchaea archaeon]